MNYEEYYKQYYEKGDFTREATKEEKKRYELALTAISKESKTVFEIGCNCGRLIKRILEQKPNIETIYGIDINRQALEFAKQRRFPDFVTLEQKNIVEMELNKTFDTVIAIEVVEHLFKMKNVLRKLYSIADKELIFSTPFNEKPRFCVCHKCLHKTHIGAHVNYYITEETIKDIFPTEQVEIKIFNYTKELKKKGNPDPFKRVFRQLLLNLFFPKTKGLFVKVVKGGSKG